uniref:Uncharacterized protein n=1 Tax=Pseudomonas fluorescens (strain SBW25) TaxID=216595 RepID=A0A0G4E5J3_PSEFS|nr:hypothetical protein PQBR57_0294 [Pseudomonas fluorescens SBW25]
MVQRTYPTHVRSGTATHEFSRYGNRAAHKDKARAEAG